MRGMLTPSRYRGLAVALLVCALAMRVLIPSGFMLMPDAHGATLVICPGQGEMPAPMAHDMMAMPGHDMADMSGHTDKQPKGHEDKAGEHACAFSPAGAVADLATTLHPIAPSRAETNAVALFHAYARPGLGLAAPPPPKTGPPLQA